MSVNPQERGFNYGQPIKIIPPEWQDWSARADRERQASVHSTNASWSLDAALRDIRIATTVEQYVVAYEKARLTFASFAPVDSFERVSTIPKPAVSATVENETDKAIHERDLKRLVRAARGVVKSINNGGFLGYYAETELRVALGRFDNVDA